MGQCDVLYLVETCEPEEQRIVRGKYLLGGASCICFIGLLGKNDHQLDGLKQ